MDEETKKLLKENLTISQENNLMLAKLVRIQKWTQIYRVVYWLVIIGITVGAFYFVQPFISNLTNLYSGGLSGVTNIDDIAKSLNNQQQMQEFKDLLKGN